MMTGRKIRALQVPPVVPCKALGNVPKALHGTTGGTCRGQLSSCLRESSSCRRIEQVGEARRKVGEKTVSFFGKAHDSEKYSRSPSNVNRQ